MPKPKFNDDPQGYGGHWSTKDITVAALCASMGIRFRGKSPIMHIVHANRLITAVDKNTGRIDNAQSIGYYFDFQTNHPVHGIVSCAAIDAAYDKRSLEVELQEKEWVNPNRIEVLNRSLKAHNVTDALYREVCQMADAMENILIIAAGVEELIADPLIQITRQLKKGKLDFLRPLETEPIAQRFMEKFNANN